MDIKKCYLFFEGYHAVAAASDLLQRYRIGNRIVKAPLSLQGNCSFAVLVSEKDMEMSILLLEQKKVHLKGKGCI